MAVSSILNIIILLEELFELYITTYVCVCVYI